MALLRPSSPQETVHKHCFFPHKIKTPNRGFNFCAWERNLSRYTSGTGFISYSLRSVRYIQPFQVLSRKLTFSPRKLKRPKKGLFKFVRGRGLEPPCLAAPAPKAGVSTVSPPTHFFGCAEEYSIKLNFVSRAKNNPSCQSPCFLVHYHAQINTCPLSSVGRAAPS